MKTGIKFALIVSLVMGMNVAVVAAEIPYGMGGCGLGALIIKKNGLSSQLGSALINNLVFPATFAMSSGTSNCTEDVSEISAVEKNVYIAANYESIAKEAAQGNGEHLDTLASLLGCSAQSRADFARFSQKRYKELFNGNKPEGLLERFESGVRSNAELADRCTSVS